MSVLFAASFTINCKRLVDLSFRLSYMSVGLSVSLSGKCTVAKWLIGSGCRLGWWVGLVEG